MRAWPSNSRQQLSADRWSGVSAAAASSQLLHTIAVRSIRSQQPSRSRTRLAVLMVEGHGCHRVGHAHRKLLLGHAFQCTSPNGRFADGAAEINNKFLVRIEVIGKNLFYFFGPTNSPAAATSVVHIHFGMSGAFKVLSLPGPPPRETTRLAMLSTERGLVCHLSAMTVTLGPPSLFEEKAAKLGPDPLREDADKELLWAALQRCKKPIGLVLMSQDLVAGIGNIYRAEILFKAGVHPEQPARSVSRRAFESIWAHSVALLQRGFVSGSILTVDPEEAKVLGKPWTRRYIYNQSSCGRCRSAVKVWDMAARKVYCCPTCQPLVTVTTTTTTTTSLELPGGLELATPLPKGRKRPAPRTPACGGAEAPDAALLSPARQAALAAATSARPFRSHCAPDDASALPPAKMTLAELKAKLGPGAKGSKALLVAQLEAALASAAAEPQAGAQGGSAASDDEEADSAPGSDAEGDLTVAVLRGKLPPSSQAAQGASPGAGDGGQVVVEAAPASAQECAQWSVQRLKAELKARGLPVTGRKGELLLRLAAHGAQGPARGPASPQGADLPAGRAPASSAAQRQPEEAAAVGYDVVPGTAALVHAMASAKEAALEKEMAAEGRNVEHVALGDDETEALIAKLREPKRQRATR